MWIHYFNLPLALVLVFASGCQRGEHARRAPAQVRADAPQSTDAAALIKSEPLVPHTPSADSAGENTSTLFEQVPSQRTGVDFQMQIPDVAKYVRRIIHLNTNGGLCTGDYDGDGLADFYVTSPVGGNRLYRNLGDFRFADVTAEAGVEDTQFWGTGATFADVDNDGDLDLYACGYLVPNRLYINLGRDGSGQVRFEEQAAERGLAFDGASMTMAFADMDNDGDLDAYLATTAKAPPPGTRFEVRFEGNKPVVLEALREYWQLIYLPGDRAHRTESGQFDHLFRNDNGRFTEVTKEAGIDGTYFTLSAVWWDYNQDGFADIYVSNDFMGPDLLYHNNGDGTFTDVAPQLLPHTPWFSMGADLGDVNNDGRMDILTTDMLARSHYREMLMMGNMFGSYWFLEIPEPRQYMRNALFLNAAAGRLLEAAFLTNMARTDWTWSPRLADFDNDGRIDLFITNGVTRDVMNADLSKYADTRFQPSTPQWSQFWAQEKLHKEHNIALRNLGELEFADVGAEWGLDRLGVSFGIATADFDNDGDLDMAVNNADAPISMYRNRSEQGHRVRIHLVGTTSNRFGVGATVELDAGGLRQTQYVTLARGWLSASEPVTTFGLGDAATIDQLTVTWPSGHIQQLADLQADHLHTITEPAGAPHRPHTARQPSSDSLSDSTATLFGPCRQFPDIEHGEAPFDDLARQPLLPHKLSESGPTMAWADVEGDGDADVFVGGAKDTSGRLLINTGGGWFNEAPSEALQEDRRSEDTDAVFFDADADGDLDLYVVSGSVEHPQGDPAYRDRLYINDGKGRFHKAAAALPDLRDSGSVVAACDFDQDGDQDLFVGSRCRPGEYPLAPANRLLLSGDGQFQVQSLEVLEQAGMVTDAVWGDLNGDTWQELVLTTDWGPVRIFHNQRGRLVEVTQEAGLADRLGWWRAVAAGDVDHDGDLDLVVTNFGLNSKYQATPQRPERLYYGDFDGSGQPRIVEARIEGDVWYPHRDRDTLLSAMPFLKDKFPTYGDFARSSLADSFTEQRLDEATMLEVNSLESGVLLNDGDFHFRFTPLPRLAQIAPCLGVDVGDVTGDGHLDIVLAQNYFSPQRETGRQDGGVSLLLVGNGRGHFEPLWPAASGIVVPGDARQVRIVDLDGDQRPDLVFAVRDGPMRAFENLGARPAF